MREQVKSATGTTGYMPVSAGGVGGLSGGGDGYVDVAQSNVGGYIDVDDDGAPRAPYLEVSPPAPYLEVSPPAAVKSGYVDVAPMTAAKSPLDPEFDGFDDDDDDDDSSQLTAAALTQPVAAPANIANMDC